MTVKFEYPNKFTFSKIKTKTESVRPLVSGLSNYVFRIKNPFVGININPKTGVIIISNKTVPGNYILDIDCVDSVNNETYSTKHIAFVRDPNKIFPGDDELTDDCEFKSNKKSKKSKKSNNHNNKFIDNTNIYNYLDKIIDNKQNVWLITIVFTILITYLKFIKF